MHICRGSAAAFCTAATLVVSMLCGRVRKYRQLHYTKEQDAYFSQTYYQARHRFREAARAAGAELSTHLVCKDDQTGLDLTIDVAVVRGTSEGKSLLVHVSGTHGAEGFAGSAVQVRMLNVLRPGCVAPTIVFIHALNPYGMANNRRFNENNVDLNRNALTPESRARMLQRKPNDFGYETFSPIFNPSRPYTFLDELLFLPLSLVRILRYGFKRLKSVAVTGQYHNPRGIMYGGGKDLERSHVIAGEVLRPFAEVATSVVLIDVHTGLGPSGVDTLMIAPGQRDLTKNIFPRHSPKFIDDPQVGGPAGGVTYLNADGYVTNYIDLFFAKAAFRYSVTQEFGTVASTCVLWALIRENAAYQHAPGTTTWRVASESVKDAFYVQSAFWKRSVLTRGEVLCEQAIQYLSSR